MSLRAAHLHLMVVLGVLLLGGSPTSLEGQRVEQGSDVGIGGLALFHSAGPQAEPLDIFAGGVVEPGFGFEVSAARRFGRLPLIVRGSWSRHRHGLGTSSVAVDGESDLFRAMILVQRGLMQNGRLVAEAGGGVFGSHSRTTFPRAGQEIGLVGVGSGTEVRELAPHLGAGLSLVLGRLPASTRLGVRGGVEMAFTEREPTLVFPVSVSITR
jgi:hypothetical protein